MLITLLAKYRERESVADDRTNGALNSPSLRSPFQHRLLLGYCVLSGALPPFFFLDGGQRVKRSIVRARSRFGDHGVIRHTATRAHFGRARCVRRGMNMTVRHDTPTFLTGTPGKVRLPVWDYLSNPNHRQAAHSALYQSIMIITDENESARSKGVSPREECTLTSALGGKGFDEEVQLLESVRLSGDDSDLTMLQSRDDDRPASGTAVEDIGGDCTPRGEDHPGFSSSVRLSSAWKRAGNIQHQPAGRTHDTDHQLPGQPSLSQPCG